MSDRTKILLCIAVIVLACIAGFFHYKSISADITPMLAWGEVTVDGGSAPFGTKVEVFIGDDTSPGGVYDVKTPGVYGAMVVNGDDSKYGELLTYTVDGRVAAQLGPDKGVFGLKNQVVNIAVVTQQEKVWTFDSPGCVPRHLPDIFYGEVDINALEDIPSEVQGVYKHDDNLLEWLFWGAGAPGAKLNKLVGGTFADYMICVVGECEWVVPLK